MENKIKYVIVQASGKGTRMQHLTKNKPKALIPVNGKPLLYHLEKVFPKAKFYILGDYKFKVFEKYFLVNKPPFDYLLIKTEGEGSCQGLQLAREIIEKEGGDHFALTWCDILYNEQIKIPKEKVNYIGITDTFPCRWRYENNILEEIKSERNGVMGFFYFGDLRSLPKIPENGEFVRFLKETNQKLEPLKINNAIELGTLENYKNFLKNNYNTRFFNEIKEENGKIIKKCILEEFKNLIECETNWYKYLTNKKYQNIPKIFSYNPLTMEKINGWHPYEYEKYKPDVSKKELTEKIICALKDLHSIEKIKYNKEEAFNVYIKKTLERIHKVKPIIPYNEAEYFYVNGKKVINLFHPSTRGYLEKLFNEIYFPPYYTIIHGDPTFSNILIENKTKRIVFIDPRGYFATTKIYGDPYYDFAKLYYSAIGNYDMFNQRNFILDINGIEVNIKIESNGFEETEKVFLKHFTNKEMKNIRILHTLIWLSLSGYVLDDVDSMIGAYFKGLELLKEVEELD